MSEQNFFECGPAPEPYGRDTEMAMMDAVMRILSDSILSAGGGANVNVRKEEAELILRYNVAMNGRQWRRD